MDEWLRAALAEDLGERGDVTSALALGGRGPPAAGRILAKEAGRLSGLGPATRVFTLVDPQVTVTVRRKDGAAVQPARQHRSDSRQQPELVPFQRLERQLDAGAGLLRRHRRRRGQPRAHDGQRAHGEQAPARSATGARRLRSVHARIDGCAAPA